jgi:hypothetical protein
VKRGALLISIAALLSGCGSSQKAAPPSSSQPAPLSAKQLVARTLEAARKSSSFHFDFAARMGKRRMTGSLDATPTSGHQVVDIGRIHAEAVVVNGKAYITGNRAAYAEYFKFSPQAAPLLAGKWVSYTPADAGFDVVARDVTMKSFFGRFPFTNVKPDTKHTTIRGQRVVAIRGAFDGGKAVLYVGLDSLGLPVRFETTKGSFTGRYDFSQWNSPVQIATPTAFSISALRGGAAS